MKWYTQQLILDKLWVFKCLARHRQTCKNERSHGSGYAATNARERARASTELTGTCAIAKLVKKAFRRMRYAFNWAYIGLLLVFCCTAEHIDII